jgi:hypothetical protein
MKLTEDVDLVAPVLQHNFYSCLRTSYLHRLGCSRREGPSHLSCHGFFCLSFVFLSKKAQATFDELRAWSTFTTSSLIRLDRRDRWNWKDILQSRRASEVLLYCRHRLPRGYNRIARVSMQGISAGVVPQQKRRRKLTERSRLGCMTCRSVRFE